MCDLLVRLRSGSKQSGQIETDHAEKNPQDPSHIPGKNLEVSIEHYDGIFSVVGSGRDVKDNGDPAGTCSAAICDLVMRLRLRLEVVARSKTISGKESRNLGFAESS